MLLQEIYINKNDNFEIKQIKKKILSGVFALAFLATAGLGEQKFEK